MILKFDFQRDEVSFFFLLSHPTTLSCIAGIHHIIKFLAAEQFAQNIELRLLGIMYQQFPFSRKNRQILKTPVLIAFIVVFRSCILCQMPQTPAYHAIPTLQIPILLSVCTDYLGYGSGYIRFFCNHQIFQFFPSLQKTGIAFRLSLHPYVTVFLCAIFVVGLIILVHSRKALVGFQIFTLRRFFFRLRLINVEVEESTCAAQRSHEHQQQNLIHATA